jgi:hypothetical protein
VLYLLDANVLITANNSYYPMNRIPEFWEWLLHMGDSGNVKIPLEIYEELRDGTDVLTDWVKVDDHKIALCLNEEVDPELVSRVINEGYAPDLTDEEVEETGRDPFLIAYALADTQNRCLVTTEVSKPKRKRGNRHIPDVCRDLQIPWCNSFELYQALNFTTSWRK